MKKLLPAITVSIFILLGAKSIHADLDSNSFKIKGDTFSAGSSGGTSTSYKISGDVNPFSDLANSASFRQERGYNPLLQAFTPEAPTFTNPSLYYSKLRLTLNPSNNPSDTLFAIAVSSDDFVTTKYVQSDNSLSSTLGIEDYQTYSAWGGGSGLLVLGLDPSTTYKAQVKALHGDFTETGYGPASAGVATSVPFITLSTPAGNASLATLNVSSVNSTTDVALTINTNGDNGYQSYIRGTGNGSNPGLAHANGTLIPSSDTTLIAGIAGYGAQASSATASIAAKYNVIGDTVGAVELTAQQLSSRNQPVTDEVTNVRFKSTISNTTTAGTYTDTVYFTISSNL